MRNKLWFSLIWLVLPLDAQQPPATSGGTGNTIQALIEEVRLLRIAVERSTAVVPRFQMTMSRFQSQQDRVERLERELRTMRAQVADAAMGRERIATVASRLEEQLRQTQDAVLQKQLQEGLKGMHAEVEQQALREQQTRQQEAELATQLRTEQAKLNELSNQLDQLDRRLPNQ